MSARDVLADTTIADDGAWLGYYGADAILAALRAMPEPDRLSLARELAGPGYAVVPVEPTLEMLQDGRRAHLKAYRPSVSGMTIDAQTRAECAREFACWTAMLTAAQEPTP